MSQTRRAACTGNRLVLPDDAFLCIIGGISFACLAWGKNGAASVIRTRDLTLTKGALYRWSYGSIKLVLRRDAMPDEFWFRLPQKTALLLAVLPKFDKIKSMRWLRVGISAGSAPAFVCVG